MVTKKAQAAKPEVKDEAAVAEVAPPKAAPYPTNRHGTSAASDARADVGKLGEWKGYGAAPVFAKPVGSPTREYAAPAKPTTK